MKYDDAWRERQRESHIDHWTQKGHEPIAKHCVICGKEFSVKPSKSWQKTCCEPACRKAIKMGHWNPFFGKHHTEEAKQKNSEAHSGKTRYGDSAPPVTVECSCGCGTVLVMPSWRAKHSKQGIYFVNRQHYFSWLIGPNHWNFRGGPVPYGEGWNQIADQIRERDRICQMCGRTPEDNGRALDVHHKIPFRVSRDNSPDNLVALCMGCHHSITNTDEIAYAPHYVRLATCVVCGTTFERSSSGSRIFCGLECRKKREREIGRSHDRQRTAAKTEYARQWRAKNREHVNAYARARKAAKRQAILPLGPDRTR